MHTDLTSMLLLSPTLAKEIQEKHHPSVCEFTEGKVDGSLKSVLLSVCLTVSYCQWFNVNDQSAIGVKDLFHLFMESMHYPANIFPCQHLKCPRIFRCH